MSPSRTEAASVTAGASSAPEGQRNGHPPLIAPNRWYTKAVTDFSRLPTGDGQNHERLAEFLGCLLHGSGSQASSYSEPSSLPFLTVYELHDTSSSTGDTSGSGTLQPSSASSHHRKSAKRFDLSDGEHYDRPEMYGQKETRGKEYVSGLLLFLRGYPSPSWLDTIGSKHVVDPDMFARWLDFRTKDDKSHNFSRPGLASKGWNILELPIVNIGSITSTNIQSQTQLDNARKAWAAGLDQFHTALNGASRIPVGTSVIRGLHLLSQDRFSIVQKITVCMQPEDKFKGWTLVIWSDASDDLSTSVNEGPWSNIPERYKPQGYHLWPVIRYRPNTGLQAHSISKRVQATRGKLPPTVAQLHLDYGRSLRPEVMAEDPFYALNEVFELSASSQKQFLNFLESTLEQYSAKLDMGDFDGLPSFQYLKSILVQQLKHIQLAQASIQNATSIRWPEAANDAGIRARKLVEQDFGHLEKHALALDARCQENITNLMASLSIHESKRGLKQASRIEKLTLIASIFVPLSFTTSFFGMNVGELGGSSLGTWFAVSLPVLFIALVMFFCPIHDYWKWVGQQAQHAWHYFN